MSLTRIQNLIGGRWSIPFRTVARRHQSGDRRVIAKVPDSNAAGSSTVPCAAARRFPAWSSLPIADRSRTLMKLGRFDRSNLDALARDESNDNGKPISLSSAVDIPRAATNFRFLRSCDCRLCQRIACVSRRSQLHAAQAAGRRRLHLALESAALFVHLEGRSGTGRRQLRDRQTVRDHTADGVPLVGTGDRSGPAAGRLEHRARSGSTAGAALVAHPGVSAISFTGGTQTGAKIAAEVAPRFKKLSLELGGKNPNIIFADCDYEEMLDTTLRSSFANQGQICLCGSRVLIERPLYDKFRDDLVDEPNK